MLFKSNSEIGKYGEEIGVTYLKKIGYKIVQLNYRCPIGEIDVVAKYKGFLVFVEIKARLQSAYGYPEEAVHPAKQRKIIRVAEWYLKENRLPDVQARFDVLAVSLNQEGGFEFRIIENAFEAGQG